MKYVLHVMAFLALHTNILADEPPTKYALVTPRDIDIIATGLNSRGDLVGFEWIESEETPGVVSQRPFYARGKTLVVLPLLEGYRKLAESPHPSGVG